MFKLLRRLESDESLAVKWFTFNYINLSEDKCHLLVGHLYRHESLWANVGCSKILESQSEKLHGVIFVKKLNFKDYFLSICN